MKKESLHNWKKTSKCWKTRKGILRRNFSAGNLSPEKLQEYFERHAEIIIKELDLKSDRWLELSERAS
jgi:hypothetical protein